MEARVERLLGRSVRDAAGRRVGRIEEIRAERDGHDWVVQSYVLGLGGLLERIAAGGLVRALLGGLTFGHRQRTIAWDELDLRDPERPRLHKPRTSRPCSRYMKRRQTTREEIHESCADGAADPLSSSE